MDFLVGVITDHGCVLRPSSVAVIGGGRERRQEATHLGALTPPGLCSWCGAGTGVRGCVSDCKELSLPLWLEDILIKMPQAWQSPRRATIPTISSYFLLS